MKKDTNTSEKINPRTLAIDNLILKGSRRVLDAIWQKVLTYRWIVIGLLLAAFIFYRSALIKFAIALCTTLGVVAAAVFVLWGMSVLARIFFGCEFCNATGTVNGLDKHLDITFDNDCCYACHGKRLRFIKSNDWYKTAIRSVDKVKTHQLRIAKIKNELGSYQSTVKISPSLNDEFIEKRYRAQKQSLFDALALEEAQCELFKVIHQKAVLILHQQYLHLLQNHWEKRIRRSREDKFDNYSAAMSASEEIEISTTFEDEYTSLNHYLESLGDSQGDSNLLQDIRKATKRLKADNRALRA